MERPSSEGRSGEPRERILEAAAQVFAEKGFDGAGVDEIAQRAGVNKAMLYYHVGDKATLYGEVTSRFLEQVAGEIDRRLAGVTVSSEKIRAIQHAFLQVFHDLPDYPCLMQREIADGGSHLPPQALAAMAGVMERTRRIVAEGREDGSLRDVHPLLAHLMIVSTSMFVSNAQRMRGRLDAIGVLPEDTPPDVMTMADALTDALLYGLAKPEKRGGTR